MSGLLADSVLCASKSIFFFFFVSTATTLIDAKIITHLNECHSLITSLASFLLYKSIFYTVVLLVFKNKQTKKPRKSPLLTVLKWLPASNKNILYKHFTMVYRVLLNAAPSYISSFISYYSLFTRSQPFSSISISQTCQIPVCFGSGIYP